MSPRQARIGVDIFTAMVVISVGVALAGTTWRLLGDPGGRLGARPVAVRPAPPVDIAPLVALAPFGTASGVATGTAATNQPLILRGILLAEPRAVSSALISVGDAAPVAFYRGQTLGSATIDAIEADHVVLLSGGARTVLGFPQHDAPVPQPASPAASSAPMPPPGPMSPATGMAMLDSLGATPSGAGLVVGNPNPAMRMAGLQAGDQIVAINGAPANELARNPALLQPIVAAGSARVDIVRAGQRLTLSVSTR